MQHTELLSEDESPETEDSLEISFGNQLAEKRNTANITQDELASRLGCTRGYMSFLENNRGVPGESIHNKLIEIFGEFSELTDDLRSEKILAVEMEDGSWISEDKAIDTFIEVIKVIGIEKVKREKLHVNGIPLVADRDYTDKAQRKVEIDNMTYHIVSGTNTKTKKKILEDITDLLQLDITVFANPKT